MQATRARGVFDKCYQPFQFEGFDQMGSPDQEEGQQGKGATGTSGKLMLESLNFSYRSRDQTRTKKL